MSQQAHSHEGGETHSHPHASHSHDHHQPGPEMPQDEAAHHATIIATFDTYAQSAFAANQRRRADFFSLPERQRNLLPGYTALLREVDQAIRVNQSFLDKVTAVSVFGDDYNARAAALSANPPSQSDHEKLRSTLRQIVRDWTEEGKRERETAYAPILDALKREIPDAAGREVLVPGAGLGRLAWETVRSGYNCQANEFSLHMLFVSNFILNCSKEVETHLVHPYIHSFSNFRTKNDLLQAVRIPDVSPDEIAESDAEFSFAAGDFLDVYMKQEWDAVLTCFFIDTARNIVDYLERIFYILKPGGVWINLGPTLWHWENNSEGMSIEILGDDIKALATRLGFIITEEREIVTTYTSNPNCMLRYEYTALFWVARKPLSQ